MPRFVKKMVCLRCDPKKKYAELRVDPVYRGWAARYEVICNWCALQTDWYDTVAEAEQAWERISRVSEASPSSSQA